MTHGKYMQVLARNPNHLPTVPIYCTKYCTNYSLMFLVTPSVSGGMGKLQSMAVAFRKICKEWDYTCKPCPRLRLATGLNVSITTRIALLSQLILSERFGSFRWNHWSNGFVVVRFGKQSISMTLSIIIWVWFKGNTRTTKPNQLRVRMVRFDFHPRATVKMFCIWWKRT